MKSPCEPKCEFRSAACHENCKKWLEYEKKRNEEYAEKYKRAHEKDVFYKQKRKAERKMLLKEAKR